MSIRDHHDALVESPRDIDAVLAEVLERGRRRRRRRRLASAALAAVILVVAAVGVIDATTGTATRVTTAAGTSEPAASTPSSATAPATAPGQLRLEAHDWQASTRAGTRSRAAGAAYTVTVDGDEIEKGTVGTYGEAIITAPAGPVSIVITRCDFDQTVELLPGETSTVGFPCGDKEGQLPPQSIPKTTGNPTDEQLRAANRDAVRCIEAAGLVVSEADLAIDASGHFSRSIQIGLAGSGLTFDESDAVQATCEKHYLSLAFARADWLDEHGG